jgi:hypothetical protein
MMRDKWPRRTLAVCRLLIIRRLRGACNFGMMSEREQSDKTMHLLYVATRSRSGDFLADHRASHDRDRIRHAEFVRMPVEEMDW